MRKFGLGGTTSIDWSSDHHRLRFPTIIHSLSLIHYHTKVFQNGERKGRTRRPVSPIEFSIAYLFKDAHTYLFSYVPRKCSATGRIIKAKDHASVQISIGKVDENGRYTGENQTYALSGFVRAMGESDDSLNRLAQKDGFLKSVWSASR